MTESEIVSECDRLHRLLDDAEHLRRQLFNLVDLPLNSQVSTRVNSASNSPSVSLIMSGAPDLSSYNMEAPSPAASTVYLSGVDTSRSRKSRARSNLDLHRPSPELTRLLPTIGHALHRRALIAIDKYGIEMVKWKNGFTALHWAAKSNRPDICKYLLTRGANPDLLDDSGKPPRHYTTSQSVVDLLCPPNTLLSMVDLSSLPASQVECLETVSKHGWSKLKWGGGWTIMHWAFQEGRDDVIQYLKSVGVSDQIKDNKGRIPSYYCRRKNL